MPRFEVAGQLNFYNMPFQTPQSGHALAVRVRCIQGFLARALVSCIGIIDPFLTTQHSCNQARLRDSSQACRGTDLCFLALALQLVS